MNFERINYQGKEVKGMTTTSVATIVMQKTHPNRLDMRFKCNREFIAKQRQATKNMKKQPSNQLSFLSDDFFNFSRA